MNNQNNELDKLVEEQAESTTRKTRILSELLQEASDKKGFVLAHRSGMGKTLSVTGVAKTVPSYAASHTLGWIAGKILLGSEMPFMEHSIDPKTGILKVDKANADEIKQRAPDWTRQPALAAYLALPQRKFGPIIAVISPTWIDDPKHENWGADGRAIKNAAEFNHLDLEGKVGLLKVDESVKVYALDGQHRVIGIRGAKEISDSRDGLILKKQNGHPTGKYFARDQFLERFKIDIGELQSLLNDTMLVEYIPAVIKGENREEASRRIRNTFISINSYAKPTAKGENILLDETDGYAIMARRAGIMHPLFNGNGLNNRVNWKNTTIPGKRTTWYTTLQTIKNMAENYLPAVDRKKAIEWSPEFKNQMPLRPTEVELEDADNHFTTLLDHIYKLPNSICTRCN